MSSLFKLSALVVTLAFAFGSCTQTFLQAEKIITADSAETVNMVVDSLTHTIFLYPPVSSYTDATPELDSAICYGNTHPGGWLTVPMPGNFYLYTVPVAANLQHGAYGQVTFDLEALNDAKDAPVGSTTNFYVQYTNGPGFAIQQCKSIIIKGINWQGRFNFMSTLSLVALDTTAYANITDGICRTNPVSPYGGIVIDPFSDPGHFNGTTFQMYPTLTHYYVSGMSTSGSTDVELIDCRIQDFVVGVLVSPAWQNNGDEIQVTNCRIDQCRSSYASTSAQNKQCVISNLMVWSSTYDVIDEGNYGYGHTDGTNPPQIYGMSISGGTNQIFDIQSPAFGLQAYGIIAENVWRIGRVFSNVGSLISGAQIDLQQALPNVPSPDLLWWGPFTEWDACMLRVYNGSQVGGRIVMNSLANTFYGGSFSDPPICVNAEVVLGYTPAVPAFFNGVNTEYAHIYLDGNGWDSTILIGTNIPLTVNTNTFAGSFIVSASAGASIQVGDEITTHHVCYANQLTAYQSYEYPVGCTTSVSYGSVQDTVYVMNVGYKLYTGTVLNLYDQKLKTRY